MYIEYIKRLFFSVYKWLRNFLLGLTVALTSLFNLCSSHSKGSDNSQSGMEKGNSSATGREHEAKDTNPNSRDNAKGNGANAKAVVTSSGQDLPTVYEYFANSTSVTGLVAGNQRFTLNGKEIRIISGAIHYFRVHPALWRDRLRKLRALGANAVETYVAWNLHEPRKGEYDFGDGNNDLSEFANLRRFLELAQEEDLLVLLRPGPYICTEWDYGGMPSWLQRDPNMKVRENNKPYLDRVKLYFDQLLPRVADLQFTRGGPIIAIQIENEYGSFNPRAKEYLEFVQNLFNVHGFNESLHFTSDNGFGGSGMEGSLPGVLQTANFQSGPENLFRRLREVQPDMPLMAMEFWAGWFNHWGDSSQAGTTPENFGQVLESILGEWNASVNFYMFHGGTNFAFMAGGNNIGEPPYILADITSYDYDAPLSEAGDYTRKYEVASQLIEKYAVPKLRRPDRVPESEKRAYPAIQPERYLTYEDLISQVPSTSKFTLEKAVSMENLPMNNDSGQLYGYIIYRKTLQLSPDQDAIFKGSWPRDIAFLIVDGEPVNSTNDYWINSIRELPVSVSQAGNHTVDLMVEPLTRVNFGGAGDFIQQKGIAPIHQSKIEVNGQEVTDIEVIAMEFTNAWVKSLTGFTELQNSTSLRVPVLLEATLNITGAPGDTFLDMSKWNKGVVFINGFNIGRYWRIGPQQNLYVPAPLLKTGVNKITVFEQVQPHTELVFSDKPNLGAPPTPSV